jgi:hypothetical protein
MRRLLPALAVLIAVPFAQEARADLVLSFKPTASDLPATAIAAGGTIATTSVFTVDPGQTITVPVYLVERSSPPFPPDTGGILSTQGVTSGGVRLNYPGSPNGTEHAAVTAVMNGPGFDSILTLQVDNPNGFAALSEFTLSGAVKGLSVRVGTFVFRGNTPGDVITIATAPPQPGTNQFVTPTSTPLDTQPYANIFYFNGNTSAPISYTARIITTPEPKGMLALLAAAAVLVRRSFRRVAALRGTHCLLA